MSMARGGWFLVPKDMPEPDLRSSPVSIRHPESAMVWRRSFDPPLSGAWYRLELTYGAAGMVDARIALVFQDGSRLPQHFAKVARNRFVGLFRPAMPLARMDIEVSGSIPLDQPSELGLRALSKWEQRGALLRRSLDVLKGDPRSFLWRAARFAIQMQRQGRTTIPMTPATTSPAEAYAIWRERFDERPEDLDLHRSRADRLQKGPLFSIIADPDIDETQAQALGASLQAQIHEDWELFVPQTVGTERRIRALQDGSGSRAGRINAALAGAAGEFVFLPRPGTMFRPHALAVFAATLDRFPGAKLVYADDDDIGANGRENPRFKPAWSPARALSWDYLGDPCCIESSTLLAAGGVRDAGRPAQRHDLLLRATAQLAPGEVVHVAQILSHTLPYARASSTPEDRAIVRAHVERPDAATRVLADPRSPHPRVVHEIPDPPLVSLIVPTRDRAELLKKSVGSIRAKTSYPSYEIIVVDNGSREDDTQKLFESWAGDAAIRILRDRNPFNYAALNNRAAEAARGTVLGLVNNDVEVLDGSWLDEMVSLALGPGVGCVGAKLYYPDGRLQHGGVVVGIAGAAGHRHKRAARTDPGVIDSLVTVNEVSAVTAACLVVRKDIYQQVGGLDEAAFAVAYNDVDFCLKVAAAGYRNLWTPFAELNHHESVSRGRDLSPRTAERFNRENLVLRLRWGDRLLDDPYYSPNLTVDAETGAIRTQ